MRRAVAELEEFASARQTTYSSSHQVARTSHGWKSGPLTEPRGERRRSSFRLSLGVVGETLPVDENARFITDDPCIVAGGHHGDVPRAIVHLLAIVHYNLHSAGNEVPQVRRLATPGARNRLHVLRPLPARLERRTTNRPPFEVDQLELALTILEWPSLVGGLETLADQTGHDRLLTSSRDIHVALVSQCGRGPRVAPSPGIVYRLCEWSSRPSRRLPGGSRVRAAISAALQIVRGRGVPRRSTTRLVARRVVVGRRADAAAGDGAGHG